MKIAMGKEYTTVVGQTVRLLCIDRRCDDYPVVALVDEFDLYTYTAEGYYCGTGGCPQDLVEVPKWSNLNLDEPVMVKYKDEAVWRHRYFSGVDEDGKPTTWMGGAMNWSVENGATTAWDECRRPTEEELE